VPFGRDTNLFQFYAEKEVSNGFLFLFQLGIQQPLHMTARMPLQTRYRDVKRKVCRNRFRLVTVYLV